MERLWHPDVKRPESGIGIICDNHLRKVIVAQILQLHSEAAVRYIETVKSYINGNPIKVLDKPALYSESAMVMRITKLACHVASYTGYSAYAKAVKYAMMGRAALGLLLNKDVTKMILSLMPLLEEFNLKTPNDMLCVYYLGCKSELQRKHQPDIDRTTKIGVRLVQSPDTIVDLLGQHVAHANWLYVAQLPPPHDATEWATWYLSRIIAGDGWQLAAANIDSTELQDGSLCPAFALTVRKTPDFNAKNNEGKAEALLVIRGSQNLTDWRINVTRKVTSFSYRSGIDGAGVVTGGVHSGMLVAARAILGIFFWLYICDLYAI